MKTFKRTFKGTLVYGIALLMLATPHITANDGKDHYAVTDPNTMVLFPDDPVYMAGYRVLPADGPGGTDGDRAFRWAQPHAAAMVRIAAYQVQKTLGDGKYPMAIFDLSAENGDTPIGFRKDVPRGRHPDISHDGGLNLDLGYYLTSIKGTRFNPDHSACSNHFKDDKDAFQCMGPADHLDVERQTFFILQLLKINRDLFNADLLEQVPMDEVIKQAVIEKMQFWLKQKKYGVRKEYIKDVEDFFTHEGFVNKARYHHHHLHVRLNNIPFYGKYRRAFLELFKYERKIDLQLLRDRFGKRTPLIRARLLSCGMKRSVKAEFLGSVPRDKTVRFRVDNGPWVPAETGHGDHITAEINVPDSVTFKGRTARIEACFNDGTPVASTEIPLPRAEPHWFVSVDPDQIQVFLHRNKTQWKMGIAPPPAYRFYITSLSFDIFRKTPGGIVKETHPAPPGSMSFVLELPENNPNRQWMNIQLIRANLMLSSRLELTLPIYLASPKAISGGGH